MGEAAATPSLRSRRRSSWSDAALLDWVIASLGTDGQDAMTGLAGAIADAGTAGERATLGSIRHSRWRGTTVCASSRSSGGAVQTGPTGTNVNDLYIAVRSKNRPDSASGRGS